MAITYPLSIPNITEVRSVVITPLSVIGETRSIYTFEEQIQVHQGQAWKASISLKILKRARAEEWIAFILSLNGMEGTFLMGDPTGSTPRGSASSAPGTPVVNGGSQTGNTLAISGCPAGATGYLLKGDYIQLGSGSSTKLHRVLTDANTDSAGTATLDIWPNLRSSPSNGATVTVSSTQGIWRLIDAVDFPTDVGKFYELSFTCFEAL